MARRLERVLTNDPLMGIFRHVDAGYDEAVQVADRFDCKIPMQAKAHARSAGMPDRPASAVHPTGR